MWEIESYSLKINEYVSIDSWWSFIFYRIQHYEVKKPVPNDHELLCLYNLQTVMCLQNRNGTLQRGIGSTEPLLW